MLPDLTGRTRYYLLDGHAVRPVSMREWATWHARTPQCTVAHTERQGVGVTTVFVGIDSRLQPDGPPLVFETFLTPNAADDATRGLVASASSWDEALANHQHAVKRLISHATPPAGVRGERPSVHLTRRAWERVTGLFSACFRRAAP